MAKRSAGLLMYRRYGERVEVFLVHPGGPYYVRKDLGAWSIPKGEYAPGENPLETAKREFEEETGCEPEGDFRALGEIKQRGGKIVTAWAIEGDCDADATLSNMFTMEWPPHSGQFQEFPEVDRAGWFTLEEAALRLIESQVPFLDRMSRMVRENDDDSV
jgi:predicted NUDIX family NTP pyrophosphohydrolase